MSRTTRGSLSFVAVAFLLMTTVTVLSLSYDSRSSASPSRVVLAKRQGPPGNQDGQQGPSFSAAAAASSSSSEAPESSSGAPSSSSSSSSTSSETPETTTTQVTTTTSSTSTAVTTSPTTTPSTTSTTTSSSTTSTTSSDIPLTTSTTSSISSSSSSLSTTSTSVAGGTTTLVAKPVTAETTLPPSTTSVVSSSSTPSVAGAASNKSDSFWGNQKAVSATFSIVGIVSAGIIAAIVVVLVRKRKARKMSADARDTIVWSDKAAMDPYSRPQETHSPSNSISGLANQTPMDAYGGSRDPFYNSDGMYGNAPNLRPYASEAPREASYYSENFAGYGAGPGQHAQPSHADYSAYQLEDEGSYGGLHPHDQATAGGLHPPASISSRYSASPSFDSFYGADNSNIHNGSAGQAL